MPIFNQTISKVARDADVAANTVRAYANLGLVPCIRTSDGSRLFAEDAAGIVRKIYTQRQSHRAVRAAKAEVR